MKLKIEKWIEEQTKKYPIHHIDVQHSQGAVVDSFEPEPGSSDQAYAATLWNAVTEDAEGYPGQECIYMLFFFAEGEESPKCRKIVRVSATASDAETRASEAPDEKGLLAQTMRHQEATMRSSERFGQMAIRDLSEQNSRMYDRMNKMADREVESLMMLRKTLLDQGELVIRREQQRSEALIWQKAVEQLEVLAPIVLSKVMGPKPGSDEEKRAQEDLIENTPPELKLLADFWGELDPDQYDKLGVLLSIPQRAALMELRSGGIMPTLIPIVVARVMNNLSIDQMKSIQAILTTDKQQTLFMALCSTMIHTLDYQKSAALERAKEQDRIEAQAQMSEGNSVEANEGMS